MLKDDLLAILRQKNFSESVINAFSKIKREDFLPDHLATYAYEDIPLPIGIGSTISQPSTIAFMLDLLELKQGNKVLEVGSGSGYVTSLMSEIIKDGKIISLEINHRLAIQSLSLLSKDSNIQVINRSGLEGLPEYAPFDKIIISASFTNKLSLEPFISQLKDPGILVAPINQSIVKIKKEAGKLIEHEYPGFIFVPMVRETKE